MVVTILAIRHKPEPAIITPVVAERLKVESPIEARLYDALVFRGHSPQTQVRIGKYRADLDFPQYRLVLECDGKDYHTSSSQREHDRKRDTIIKSQGVESNSL